jgi:tryptophan 2,3-dioxygenase
VVRRGPTTLTSASVGPRMSKEPLYYGDYLQLDKLLDAQDLASAKAGDPIHDEMLFIVVHQAYELWFKQITWEIDSVAAIFGQDQVREQDMGTVIARLRRISKIQDLLIEQIGVMETMTPLDFLDFRDYLFPASGFQSAQFRVVENKLGLRPQDRLFLAGAEYTSRFSEGDKNRVTSLESEPSLFDLVEDWLERTPFLDYEDFHFWEEYQGAVRVRLEADRAVVETNPNLSDEEKTVQLKEFELTLKQYEAIFHADKHEHERAAGRLRLSHRAFQAALFITLYRDEPALHEPFRMLELLMDIDENFTAWRYRHAQMALRMIGRRIGTGGSAGAKYLEKSAERSRIFSDLFSLSTFLVPRTDRPALPEGILDKMRFRYEE